MRRAALALLALLALSLVVSWTRPARAQDPPQITAVVDAEVVGVGETVRLMMRASSEDMMPASPLPGATPGFVVRDSSVSPFQMHINLNGVRRDENQLTVTWLLEAQKVGSYKLGPPSVVVNGKRYAAARGVSIKVIAGRKPRATDPDPPAPTPSPYDDRPPTDAKFGLDAPRGQLGFLHAVIDKPSVVVGEQVTLAIYVYSDPRYRFYGTSDEREIAAPDFLSRFLGGDISKVVADATVGSSVYQVRLIRKWGLVPLKPGDLDIGPMTVTLIGPHQRDVNMDRVSEKLRVHVGEPPVVGRPPGYVIGDVGSFTLSADVTPRELERDGAVAVNVELTGTGNLPSKLTPPARDGIEWLEPQVRDAMGPKPGDKYGGSRTFSFIVRVHKEGDVDLGALAIPFWDPDAKRYDVARAPLGHLNVRAGGARTQGGAAEPETLGGLPSIRAERAGTASRQYLADSPLFWLGLGASPLAYVFARGARMAVRGLQRRRTERAASPFTELKDRVAAARAAVRSKDPRAIDAAIVRAVEAATVARAGVNVRGARADEVRERLEPRGVKSDVAQEIQAVLRECEDARFSPETADLEHATGRWERALSLIDKLEAKK